MKILLIILTFLKMNEVSARVFSFEKESVAPYFNLRTGMSQMGAAPFAWQSAGQYSGDKVELMYGGEFGVYFKGDLIGMSLGVLVHTFDPVEGGLGSSSGGVQLYSVNSKGMAYGPNLLFDYQISNIDNYLWKIVMGGGYQFSKIDNEYGYTLSGQALSGGQVASMETYKSASPFAVAGIATEFLMAGTTTISFLLGYHYNFQQSWKYSGGGQNIAGSYADGGDVRNEDGSVKKIDWSYPFLQIGFQFYVDKIR